MSQYFHMAQDTFNFRDLKAHGKMTSDYENIAYRELDRQKGLDSLNRGYLEAYLHDLELRQLSIP